MTERLPAKAKVYAEQQASENTRSAYILDLSKWFSFLGSRAPSVELVLEWKQQLEEAYAPNSARRIYSTVRSFYDWMRRAGEVGINPFELVKRPKVIEDQSPNQPTDDQVRRIMQAVRLHDSSSGHRHYAIMCLLLNGLRAQEVCDLRCQDFFYDEATNAKVLRVIGKGMYERLVPATDETNEALVYYIADRVLTHGQRKPTDPLLEDAIRGPVTRKQVAYVCAKYGEMAGVRGFTPHSFRHHYGTRLYRVTHDVLAVGKLLGHKKTDTTKRYARLDLADIVRTASLDPRYHKEEEYA